MKVTTINGIVRSTLVTMQLPIHYYTQFLSYALDIVNELNFDSLGLIKTTRLYTDDTHRITVPSDYIDWVKVGVEIGNRVVVMSENKSFNRLHNYDDQGQEIPYSNADADKTFPGGTYFQNYVNEYGEHLGRLYGYGAEDHQYQFKELREQGQIVLDPRIGADAKIYLEYIADTDPTALSQIHPYVVPLIKAAIITRYTDWDVKASPFLKRNREEKFKDEYEKYLSRRHAITPQTVLDILRRNTKATPRF